MIDLLELFGEIGCFSAHPLKNLNALGDSGYLTTNSTKIANFIKDVRIME